jgi:hypothetical protein
MSGAREEHQPEASHHQQGNDQTDCAGESGKRISAAGVFCGVLACRAISVTARSSTLSTLAPPEHSPSLITSALRQPEGVQGAGAGEVADDSILLVNFEADCGGEFGLDAAREIARECE